MIYQIGDSLPFQFAYLASKLGKTGIVVTVKAVYRNGAAIGALAGVAVAELGSGLYEYVLDGATYVTVAGRYTVIATTADATVDQRDLYAIEMVTPWVANIDAAISGAAVPGDAMALTAGALEDVDTELSGTHGDGSWESVGGSTTAAAVWAYADRTLTEQASTSPDVTKNNWTKTRGTAWVIDVTLSVDLSTMAAGEEIWFTYKKDREKDVDLRSLVQVNYTKGLKRLNGEEADDAALGSITILDETTGAVRLYVSEEATTQLPLLKSPGDYDVSVYRIAYGKLVRKSGKLTVEAETTRAIAGTV